MDSNPKTFSLSYLLSSFIITDGEGSQDFMRQIYLTLKIAANKKIPIMTGKRMKNCIFKRHDIDK